MQVTTVFSRRDRDARLALGWFWGKDGWPAETI
jgi:hypothetical protein